MATKVVADPATRIIEIVEAPVGGLQTLNVQDDIYEPLKDDWHADANLQKLRFPFRTFGDTVDVGKQIGPFIFFNNVAGWRFLPYDVNHELSLDGNLVGESSVQGLSTPIFNARAGRTIFVRDKTSNQATRLETGVSGLTGTESTALIQARDYSLEIRKLLRNKRVIDPTTGLETLYDDNGAVLYTRPVYIDKDGVIPYEGTQPPHRVERYT